MNDLYEAISELLCAQTIEQKSARAKDVRVAFDAVQSRLEQAEKDAARYAKLPLNEWQELEYWLDRCYDKGHLEQCSDLIEPYHNLSNAIAAMQSAKGS